MARRPALEPEQLWIVVDWGGFFVDAARPCDFSRFIHRARLENFQDVRFGLIVVCARLILFCKEVKERCFVLNFRGQVAVGNCGCSAACAILDGDFTRPRCEIVDIVHGLPSAVFFLPDGREEICDGAIERGLEIFPRHRRSDRFVLVHMIKINVRCCRFGGRDGDQGDSLVRNCTISSCLIERGQCRVVGFERSNLIFVAGVRCLLQKPAQAVELGASLD